MRNLVITPQSLLHRCKDDKILPYFALEANWISYTTTYNIAITCCSSTSASFPFPIDTRLSYHHSYCSSVCFKLQHSTKMSISSLSWTTLKIYVSFSFCFHIVLIIFLLHFILLLSHCRDWTHTCSVSLKSWGLSLTLCVVGFSLILCHLCTSVHLLTHVVVSSILIWCFKFYPICYLIRQCYKK